MSSCSLVKTHSRPTSPSTLWLLAVSCASTCSSSPPTHPPHRLSCCSFCQAHHVCVRTPTHIPIPSRHSAGEHCVCGDPMVSRHPPTVSSTNGGSRPEMKNKKNEGLWDVISLKSLLLFCVTLFVTDWCFCSPTFPSFSSSSSSSSSQHFWKMTRFLKKN